MNRTVQLTLLDRIEIASPCTASWDAMAGDDRSRFCGQCRLNVFNISAMSREEAEALILAKEGRICARIYRRADGTVLTRDCPVGLRAARARLAAGFARLGTACALGIGALLSLTGARAASARAREMQPFATICRWISPNSGPPPGAAFIAGDMAIRPLPPAPPTLPSPTTGGR